MDFTDELDHSIVMHRDAHFGGSFQEMIDYYEDESHIGIFPEFELDRIYDLQNYENQTGDNLTYALLSDEERAKVDLSKKAYAGLKKVYETEKKSPSKLIADLILSEEEEPKEALDQIVAHQKILLPDLLRLLQWEESYDPLFPGYGYAPYFALQALCFIKDPKAIIVLFETLKRDSFFGEEVIVSALVAQGEEARKFLLKALKSKPLNSDNAFAAYAIAGFHPDEEITFAALQLLKEPETWKHTSLCGYLLCLCEENKTELSALSQNPLLPQNLKKEIEQSIKK